MGDMNGRVENKNQRKEKWIGREGKDIKNENGQRLTDLCTENDLMMINTTFRHKCVDTC